MLPKSELPQRDKVRICSKVATSRSTSVPLRLDLVSVMFVTTNSAAAVSLLQLTPIQPLHGLLPTHDERVDWLCLLRLAFHFKRADASFVNSGTCRAVASEEGTQKRLKQENNTKAMVKNIEDLLIGSTRI